MKVQQFISHGHVVVNGKPSRFSGLQLSFADRVSTSFDRKPSGIKLGSFSQVFYMVYRNMYLCGRSLDGNKNTATNVEKDVKHVVDIISDEQSAYLFRPVLSLFKISSWTSVRSAILNKNQRISKEARSNQRSQLQRFLRWKRLSVNTKKIHDQVVSISKQDPALLYSRFSRCYASIVYGTRRCE